MTTAFLLLLLGFACNAASAFTTRYAHWFGDRQGQLLTGFLRNVAGIPVWVLGRARAGRLPLPSLMRVGILSAAAAWLLLGAGSLRQVLALLAIRRKAALPSVRDSLVQHGIYAHLRHPIYAGVLLQFAGIVLLRPHRATVLACALGAGWCLLQARLEELDLGQRLAGYREYMERVPRFVPRIRAALPRERGERAR
ncbi:MAG: hypothetical protein FIB01_05095 [Gemmatimonadetes bacterium]|nr:hypothetical protein [Gemmatimonadota bacterium]